MRTKGKRNKNNFMPWDRISLGVTSESNNSRLPTSETTLETSFRIWGQSLGDCSPKQTLSCTTELSHESGEMCNFFARVHLNRN